MNFLSNLVSGVKSAVSGVGSFLSDTFNRGNANLAGLFNSTNLAQSQKPPVSNVQNIVNQAYASQQTKQQTPVPVGIQAQVAQKQGGTITEGRGLTEAQMLAQTGNIPYASTGVAGLPGSGTTTAPKKGPYELESYRSALPTMTTGQADTRVSTRAAGVPFYDADTGQLITPQTGFSGLSGGGSSSVGSYFAPTGIQGLPGSGGSAFTGLLGGTGGLGTPSAVTVEDETPEGKKKVNVSMLTKLQQTPGVPQLPGVQPGTPGTQGTTSTQATPSIGSFVPPNEQLRVQVPDSFNLGSLENTRATLQKLITSPESLTSSDVASLNQNLEQAFSVAREIIDAQSPTIPNPVLETPEQLSFIEQSDDPFGVRQAMDAYRASATNLGDLQRQQIEVLKNIQALNQAYNPIFEEIKLNPDLPKGLAVRRLDEIQKKQKVQLEGFLNQADILKEMIANENESVNRQFNIAKAAQDQQESKRNSDLAKLKLFMDTGAIGGFTDADINRYAQLTGVSSSVIKKARDSAKNPDLDIYTTTDDKGTVRGIDKNTGKVVWTQAGAGGTKTVQQPDIKEFQGQYATFANRLEQAIPILFDQLAPTITNMNGAQLQAYVTANDIAPILANPLTPDNVKSYIQASRDLINAVLRKESGAVISPSEFATARGQYLPMPGDSAQLLAQKRTSAMANLNNFKNAAGGAYVPSVALQPTTGGQQSGLSAQDAYAVYLKVTGQK